MLFYVSSALLALYCWRILLARRIPYILLADNQRIRNIISMTCSLTESYTPTFWCPSGRLMTIFACLIRDWKNRKYQFDRETVKTNDGGSLSIDWARGSEEVSDSRKPVVIFVAGITNSSRANYIIEIMKYLRKKKYGCAGYVYRGRGGTKVETPVTYWTAFLDDIKQIVDIIKDRYPESRIALVGFSLGAMNVFNYLCDEALASDISCGICVSMPWNPFVSSNQLYSGIDYWLFNRKIAANLRDFAIQNFNVLSKLGVTFKDIDEISLIKHFDQLFVTKMGNYSSVYDYYIEGGPAFKLGLVKSPILAINARDDSFSFPAGIPKPQELRNVKAPIAIAEYNFGGHMGFASNMFATDFHISKVVHDFIEQSNNTNI